MLVQQSDETVAVLWLEKMHELVNDDVLKASERLFRQLGVKPDTLGLVSA